MPAYVANTSVFLAENRSISVWNAESVAANSASQAVLIERRKSNNQYPWGFAVQISNMSGTFDIEVQGSETNTDASFVKLASITTGNSASPNTGRGDYTTYWPKFVRLFARTLTGTQTLTGIITR